MKAKRLTRDAVLMGVALIIFVVEAQIPPLVAIPGVKLGLSNIITVYAAFALGPWDAAFILSGRVLLGAAFAGGLSALMYSAAGGTACLLCMLPLRRVLSTRQIWAASVVGAMAHNTAQVAVAVAVTHTPALWAQLPILFVSGIIAGLFTGLCAQFLIGRIGRSAEKQRYCDK